MYESTDNTLTPFRLRRLVDTDDTTWAAETNRLVAQEIEQMPIRFGNIVPIVEKAEALAGIRNKTAELEEVIKFGDEFYTAYYRCSGYLTNTIGPELVLRAFRALAPFWWLIAPDDYEAFRELDDELTVYRGGLGPQDVLAKGLSWTLSCASARAFMDAEGSVLLRAKVRKKDLLVFLGELQECIVEPMKLSEIGLVDL